MIIFTLCHIIYTHYILKLSEQLICILYIKSWYVKHERRHLFYYITLHYVFPMYSTMSALGMTIMI